MMAQLLTAFMLFTLIFSAVALFVPDLLYSVIFLAAASVSLSFTFLLLQAPDIAITEAAIGAALTTTLMVIAVYKTRRLE